MIPWSDGGVFMATTLGISTMHYLPFLWYSFVVLIISIIFGFKGRFIWKTDSYYSEKESYKNLKIETKDADKNIIN